MPISQNIEQSEINMDKVHLDWCIDILKRIQIMVEDQSTMDQDKLAGIRWLVKQALKVERE